MRYGKVRLGMAIVGIALLAGCTTPSAGAPPPTAAAPNPASGPPPGQPPSSLPPNPMIGGVAMYPSRDIMENLAQSPEHHSLVAALNVAGLAGALKQPGPFTVFAPTDAAFRSLPPGLLDQLMQPSNQARLAALLNNHIVAGRLDSNTLGQQVVSGNGVAELTTLAGTKLIARPNGAVNLLLRDTAGNFADISIYDIVNANGILHVIDRVMLPAQNP
jgi:uncharacterized surface protein with fasciclin (FAS1) repeats